MIVAHLESFDGTNGRYRLIDERVIAENVSEADATRITRLLNQEAESKTPTPSDLEKQAAINRKLDAYMNHWTGCSCDICRERDSLKSSWSSLRYNGVPIDPVSGKPLVSPDELRACSPEHPCLLCRLRRSS
jgi:hypothetical protein